MRHQRASTQKIKTHALKFGTWADFMWLQKMENKLKKKKQSRLSLHFHITAPDRMKVYIMLSGGFRGGGARSLGVTRLSPTPLPLPPCPIPLHETIRNDDF